ncbi:glycosyltransferase [Ulvibacterium sp.]|uniref:glycosyltransferase n=1 Tax=Ulvibacterium sp. TaxID=2665914 RepID=UPI00261F3880|nr:glycosyltransferase [Ulvibacterium sp.]
MEVAVVCKLMPLYRLGLFKELSRKRRDVNVTILGDTKGQKGIRTISLENVHYEELKKLNWAKTKNYFYRPDLLLWQTGIVKRIVGGKFEVFVFEGAISHIGIWIFAILCKLFRRKVIFWTHGDKGLDHGLKRQLRKLLFDVLGDGLFLYGRTQKQIMVCKGYNPQKLFVINNSLDFERQLLEQSNLKATKVTRLKSQLSFKNKAFTILFIGRLVPNKQIDEVVKAVGSLKNRGHLINCIIIGEGPEKDCLLGLVKELCLEDQVRLAGAIYEERELAKYFQISDLLVSPGNVGLNCIHALAYGVPVLTHNDFSFQNPEVEAIEDGVSGTLYEYGNMSDMTDKLEYWYKNKAKNSEMKKKCRMEIEKRYNPSYQSEQMINALKKLT